MNFEYYVNYFKMLEDRLQSTERYVAFDEDNISTFSVEYASIINECCALINGFCYDLCKNRRPDKKEFFMNDYKREILKNNYNAKEYIGFDKYILQPWGSLVKFSLESKESTPFWWLRYNDVKHAGETKFKESTLKNAISCLAGMFWLLYNYDLNQMGTKMSNWHGAFFDMGNCDKEISW